MNEDAPRHNNKKDEVKDEVYYDVNYDEDVIDILYYLVNVLIFTPTGSPISKLSRVLSRKCFDRFLNTVQECRLRQQQDVFLSVIT